jgi:AraC family transcriptional regulator
VVELDREPREITLADRTYFENPALLRLCQSLVGMPWGGADHLRRANEIKHDTRSELLGSQGVQRRALRLKGGLAPALRRRLAEYIDANLAQPITLGTLAQLACLSEFHLARMFRVSFGMPPSAWIARRRVESACTLLKTTALPLQQIADLCGYADLSHLAHRFRAEMGTSPRHYRQLMAR